MRNPCQPGKLQITFIYTEKIDKGKWKDSRPRLRCTWQTHSNWHDKWIEQYSRLSTLGSSKKPQQTLFGSDCFGKKRLPGTRTVTPSVNIVTLVRVLPPALACSLTHPRSPTWKWHVYPNEYCFVFHLCVHRNSRLMMDSDDLSTWTPFPFQSIPVLTSTWNWK